MNEETRSKKKTVLRTIRIDKELNDVLDKDAEERGISGNALISSILTKYVEWDRYAIKFGRVSLLNESLKAILEATDADKLKTVTEEFNNSVPKDYLMFHYKKLNVDTCLKHIYLISRYAGMFEYELHKEQERDYTVTIHHKFGDKWSYWLKESISIGIFKNVLGIVPKTHTSKNSVIFTFTMP